MMSTRHTKKITGTWRIFFLIEKIDWLHWLKIFQNEWFLFFLTPEFFWSFQFDLSEQQDQVFFMFSIRYAFFPFIGEHTHVSNTKKKHRANNNNKLIRKFIHLSYHIWIWFVDPICNTQCREYKKKWCYIQRSQTNTVIFDWNTMNLSII